MKGRWELDRGPQELAYDFWWHLGYDTAITSEWGTPNMVEAGVNPEILLAGGYGHKLHIWDLPKRRHKQEIDLGKENQMVLELRPAHDPTKAYGFVGVVTSLKDLSASIWVWHLEGSSYKVEKVIEIPAEPASEDDLPPLLKGFKAVPPLVTDINLSLDDRQLYVSAWGTGEFLQYDVSDPFKPKKTGSVHLGGIVRKAAHPSSAPLNGGPQMVEVSRDGRRIYLTNSLYASWDVQFYPEGVKSWATLINAKPEGGLSFQDGFFTEFEQRTHQIHSKAETPRPTRTATRERRLVALGSSRAARGLSRSESRDGMAVCCGARPAGAKTSGGRQLAAADRHRPRSIDRHRRDRRIADRTARAALPSAAPGCARSHHVRCVQARQATLTPKGLRHASRFHRPGRVVVPHGVGAWRWFDAGPRAAGDADRRGVPQPQ